jgi:hypothetical protein
MRAKADLALTDTGSRGIMSALVTMEPELQDRGGSNLESCFDLFLPVEEIRDCLHGLD